MEIFTGLWKGKKLGYAGGNLKIMTILLIILIFWITCGYIAHGYALGYFTHKFPWSDHASFCRFAYIFGPFALVGELLHPPLHYLQTPLTIEQRWEAFHKEWPILSREDFERVEN